MLGLVLEFGLNQTGIRRSGPTGQIGHNGPEKLQKQPTSLSPKFDEDRCDMPRILCWSWFSKGGNIGDPNGIRTRVPAVKGRV
jgi:hypothetical protein